MKKYEDLLLEMIEDKFTTAHIDNHIEPKTNIESEFKKLEIPKLTHSIKDYTQGSKEINRALWKVKKGEYEISKPQAEMIQDIHDTLDTSILPHDDISVYSGVRRNPQEMVKDSGGILHHAPFMSASMSPTVGLGFSSPVRTRLKDGSEEDVHHIIKINIRKGQKVGGYLGDKSQFSHEKEYLIKSNQVLHINPEYEEIILRGYDGNVKRRVHIHHAVILEPHELSDIKYHPEVESHIRMKESIDKHINKEEQRSVIEDYIRNRMGKDRYDDKEFVETNKLEPHHIDKIISRDYLHEELSDKQELSHRHIEYMMNHNPTLNTMIGLSNQKNLSESHVDKLLKEGDFDINYGLLKNPHKVLKHHHIDKLINEPVWGNMISRLPDLSSHHIDTLLDRGNMRDLENLSSRNDLSSHHIDRLSKIKNSKVLSNLSNNSNLNSRQIDNILAHNSEDSGYNLASRENLEPHHIDKLLDFKSSKIDNILSYRKDLNDNHISKILNNGDKRYNFLKSDVLRNINNNYKLNDSHINSILDNIDGYNEVLLNHMIKKQVGKNGIARFIDKPYIRNNINKLTESRY